MGKSSSVSMIGLLIIFVNTCACSVTKTGCQYHHNKNSISGVKVSVPSLNAVELRFKSWVIGGVKVSVLSLNTVDRRFKSRCEG